MSWLQYVKHKDGSVTYWIRDKRDGREISIFGGDTETTALHEQKKYDARLELEKAGYEDQYTVEQHKLLDQVWGPNKDKSQ